MKKETFLHNPASYIFLTVLFLSQLIQILK